MAEVRMRQGWYGVAEAPVMHRGSLGACREYIAAHGSQASMEIWVRVEGIERCLPPGYTDADFRRDYAPRAAASARRFTDD